MTRRTVRVGDTVTREGSNLRGTVERLYRADAFYHRRALVRWVTGRTDILPVSVLRVV